MPSRKAFVAAGLASGALAAAAVVTDRRRHRHDQLRDALDNRRDRDDPPGDVRLSVVVPAYKEERIGDTVRRAAQGPELEKVAHRRRPRDPRGRRRLPRRHRASSPRRPGPTSSSASRSTGARGRRCAPACSRPRGRTSPSPTPTCPTRPTRSWTCSREVEDGWDVVVGSRRHDDTATLVRERRLREFGSRGINLLTKAVLLGEHRDTQCGLKAFRSDVGPPRLPAQPRRRVRLRRRGLPPGRALQAVVASRCPCGSRTQPRSTVHVARDAFRLVRDLFRIRSVGPAGRLRPRARRRGASCTADRSARRSSGSIAGRGSD